MKFALLYLFINEAGYGGLCQEMKVAMQVFVQ